MIVKVKVDPAPGKWLKSSRIQSIKSKQFVPSVTPEAWIYGYDILPLDR